MDEINKIKYVIKGLQIAIELMNEKTTHRATYSIENTIKKTQKKTRRVIKRKNAHKKWTSIEDEQLIQLRKKGYKNIKIAKILGRTERSISNRVTILKKKGIII